jgi:osmotically-inducible protein OsmY
MADRYERQDRYDRDRDVRRDDRGMVDRATDEVRSWFGNDEAARRRERDQYEGPREPERQYGGAPYGSGDSRGWRERGYSGEPDRGDERWSGGAGRDWAGGSNVNRTYSGGDSRSYSEDSRYGETTRNYGGEYGRAGARPGGGSRSGSGYDQTRDFRDREASSFGYGPDRDSARDAFWGPRSMGGGYVGPTGGWSESRNWSESGNWSGAPERAWSQGRSPGDERYGRGSFSGRGPKGYRRSDERIREDVCDRLADDPMVDASDVEISVKEGEVTLSGFVRDREDKHRAEDLVERISGVREVHNSLRVNRGQGHPEGHPGDVIGLGPTTQGGEVRVASGASTATTPGTPTRR